MSRAGMGLCAALAVVIPPGRAEAARPQVRLHLDAPSTRGTWTVSITNDGDVPVRIAADARLLALAVTPRGARRAVRCELPADMRPESDLERPLVLPPKRTYAEDFEPRLYCFGEKGLSALAPGSVVFARLGWAGKAVQSFVVSPLDGVEPRVDPTGVIDAPPIALPDEPTPTRVPAATRGDDDDTPSLSVRSGLAVDAESASAIELPVTVRNDGAHSVVLRFRPESLRFDLEGPAGAEHCAWPAQPASPTREQFTTLRPGAKASLSVELSAYCSAHAFDQAGLYVVRASVDTRKESGTAIGLRTFDGEVVAAAPTVVRLHRGRAPKLGPPPKLRTDEGSP